MTEPSRDSVRSLLLRAADSTPGNPARPTVEEFRARRRHARVLAGAIAAMVAVVLVVATLATALMRHSPSTTPPAGGHSAIGPLPSQGHVTADQLRSYRWSSLPKAPIAARPGAAIVWTGSQMIVWGGADSKRYYTDGAAYDPATRSWTTLPHAPLAPRSEPYALWTGTRMIIWGGIGGKEGNKTLQDGAVYDPSTHRWTVMAANTLAGQSGDPTFSDNDFVWDATVAVRLTLDNRFAAGRMRADAYDPATNRWSRLPDLVFDPVNNYTGATAAVVGGRLVVWISSGKSYRLAASSRSWSPVSYKPASRCIYKVVVAGASIIYPADFNMTACGDDLAYRSGTRGVQYDLRTKHFRQIAYTATSDSGAISVWTGRALLNANTTTSPTTDPGTTVVAKPGDTAAWDPYTNRWIALSRQPADDRANWVWTGTQLLGFGSSGGVAFSG